MSTSLRSLSSTLGKRPSQMTTSTSTSTAAANDLPVIRESSTSARSILPLSSSPAPQPVHSSFHQRSPSPPASSYFPSVSVTQDGEPLPTPGAANHFAYSTTLRRHHHEATFNLQLPQNLADEGLPSLWQKSKDVITRQLSRDTPENHYELVSTGEWVGQPQKYRETPSARFANWTAEVRTRLVLFIYIPLRVCYIPIQLFWKPWSFVRHRLICAYFMLALSPKRIMSLATCQTNIELNQFALLGHASTFSDIISLRSVECIDSSPASCPWIQ